ncbi:MAG: hypothetical protein ABEI77_09375 [Halorientalis sp.]
MNEEDLSSHVVALGNRIFVADDGDLIETISRALTVFALIYLLTFAFGYTLAAIGAHMAPTPAWIVTTTIVLTALAVYYRE